MKKLLTILLTLALTLSLSVPALAAPAEEEGYPLEEEVAAWMEAHPEETAALEENLDAYALENWGYDSVAEMAQDWGLPEEYVRAMLLEEQIMVILDEEERAAFLEEYKAAHPKVLEQFDPDAWFQLVYGAQYRPPVEAFMEDYSLTTRQEFEDYMTWDFVDHLMYMDELQSEVDGALAKDPHALDQFDPDAYFAQEYSCYQDQEAFMADYELLDRQEFETYLSWEYLFDAWDPGGPEPPVTVPGELGIMVNGTYLDFDGERKPYADRGITYVPSDVLGEAMGLTLPGEYAPLRDTAEAAGYQVWWDAAYSTAVILNPEALAREVDSRFTIANEILNVHNKEWERWQSKAKGELDLTLFDTLNGDKICRMTYTADALYGPEGIQVQGAYDFAQLLDQIEAASDPETVQLLKGLLTGDYELRYDSASGDMAVTISCLPQLLAAMGAPGGETALWISLTGEDTAGWDSLLRLQSGGFTVGSLIAATCETGNMGCEEPVFYWSRAMTGADELAFFLGDDAFTRQGNAWVLEMDPAAMGWYMGSEEFKLECTFMDSGAVSGALWVQTPDGGSWSPATRLALEWNVTASRGTMELEYHIKNQMKLVVNITSTMTETTARPETLPPEDAAVQPA